MFERRPATPSEEPGPRSSAPLSVSVRPIQGSAQPPTMLPSSISAAGLLGIAGYVLVRLTMPPDEVASDCLHAALAGEQAQRTDPKLDIELVATGRLDAGGKPAAPALIGALSDPIRRRAIEHCRSLYAKQTGVSATLPLLEVDNAAVLVDVRRTLRAGSSPLARVDHPVSGASVSVENRSGQGSCITSLSGQCELMLWGVAHDARLTVVAKLDDGTTVTRSSTVLELLRDGSRLDVQQRRPALPQPPDCSAARLSLENGAQFTAVPPAAAGHQLEARVDVSSSGHVARVAPIAEADPKALTALRAQLAALQGLPGPCNDLRVSLHY